MDYSDKTDFEINKMVGEKRYPMAKKAWDFCNNPSDAWPIILENKIDIAFLKCEPNTALAANGDNYAREKNPLRAAMIVYLMISDNKGN